ncbi:unnamed protein product, partial [Pylaiella littoralis]
QQAQRIREHNEDMRQLMSTNTSGMASLSVAGGGGGASSSESGVAGVEEEFRQELTNLAGVVNELRTKLTAVTGELAQRNLDLRNAGVAPSSGAGSSASNPLTVGGPGGSQIERDAQTSNAQHWRKRHNQILWCLRGKRGVDTGSSVADLQSVMGDNVLVTERV